MVVEVGTVPVDEWGQPLLWRGDVPQKAIRLKRVKGFDFVLAQFLIRDERSLWQGAFTATTPCPFDYEVRAVLTKDDVARVAASKRVFSPKFYLPEVRDTNTVTCVFAKSEIPSNRERDLIDPSAFLDGEPADVTCENRNDAIKFAVRRSKTPSVRLNAVCTTSRFEKGNPANEETTDDGGGGRVRVDVTCRGAAAEIGA